MTRETKVGLLVGMGVILLIGIIVSDQLSSIQRQDAADLTDFAERSQDAIAPLGAVEPHFDTAIDARADFLTPPGSTALSGVPAGDDTPVPHETVDIPADAYERPVIEPQRRAGDSFLEQMALRTRATAPVAREMPIDREYVAGVSAETVIPLSADRLVPSLALDGATREAAGPPSSEARAAASNVTHTVAEGDSLYRIAEKYLGDGTAWKKIAEANPGKVTADGQVRAGVELAIPGASASAAASPARATPTPPAASKTYTVRAGDSLYSIAKSQLNDGGQWKKIYEANRDKLRNPDAVQAGMTLKIPG